MSSMDRDMSATSPSFVLPFNVGSAAGWFTPRRCSIAGWLMWLILVVTVTYTVLVFEERSVTTSYRAAAWNWMDGKPLYTWRGRGFIYLPQAALAFIPWAVLPHMTGEILWRLCNIVVLVASVMRLTRLLNGDGRWFFAISICTCIMSWGCGRNGQSTLLITGMMILAAADLSEKNWWRAAVTLAIAFAVKPLAIVLVLLAGVVYPAVFWRLLVCLLAVIVIPFLTQSPTYVVSQYGACLESLQGSFEIGETENWAQLFGMLNVAGISIVPATRNVIRIAAALATLTLSCVVARSASPQKAAFYIFSLAACYIMLFNSRTEGNTYAMVGPVYGALLAEAMFRFKNPTRIAAMVAAVLMSALNYDLAILFCKRENAIWISPLVCALVSIDLARRSLQERPQVDAHTSPKLSTSYVSSRIKDLHSAADQNLIPTDG